MTFTIRPATARALALALALLPAAVSAQQTSRAPRPATPAALGIQGFSVVLVVGSLQGPAGASSDGIPDSARKALADMKEFLPYKRYQLLDAAWMMCCASARSGVSGRVRGPDERDYRYQVDPLSVSDTRLDVRFTIRELAEPPLGGTNRGNVSDSARLEHARQLHEALREREETEVRLRTTQQKFEVGLVAAPEMEAIVQRNRRAAQRVEQLQRLPGGAAQRGTAGLNIIDSTFSVAPGETVVVGTSRLHGDRALIAILTAAARRPAPRDR